ncbi:hypothetical protein BJ166DRAFT_239648 [Pestalotiopsis sp. NC0098]|nr:hypothetical protein BJ166DRAFT_239648 [Pestalotiopsis sp. NC0098]
MCAEASSAPRYNRPKGTEFVSEQAGVDDMPSTKVLLKSHPELRSASSPLCEKCMQSLFNDIQFAGSQVCLREDAATKYSTLGSLLFEERIQWLHRRSPFSCGTIRSNIDMAFFFPGHVQYLLVDKYRSFCQPTPADYGNILGIFHASAAGATIATPWGSLRCIFRHLCLRLASQWYSDLTPSTPVHVVFHHRSEGRFPVWLPFISGARRK